MGHVRERGSTSSRVLSDAGFGWFADSSPSVTWASHRTMWRGVFAEAVFVARVGRLDGV